MLDLEPRLHSERGTLLDGERVLAQILQRAGLAGVDDDVLSALDLQAEGVDDDFARVVGVGEVVSGPETERGFPFFERFVVGVWCC